MEEWHLSIDHGGRDCFEAADGTRSGVLRFYKAGLDGEGQEALHMRRQLHLVVGQSAMQPLPILSLPKIDCLKNALSFHIPVYRYIRIFCKFSFKIKFRIFVQLLKLIGNHAFDFKVCFATWLKILAKTGKVML